MLGRLIDKLTKGPTLDAHPVYTPMYDEIEDYAKKDSYLNFYNRPSFKGCDAYDKLKALKGSDKIEAMHFLLKRTNFLLQFYKDRSYSENDDSRAYIAHCWILDSLFRTKFEFPIDYNFADLFDAFYLRNDKTNKKRINIEHRPFTGLTMQMEKHLKRHGLTDRLKKDVEHILSTRLMAPIITQMNEPSYWGQDLGKGIKRLQQILIVDGDASSVPPFEFGTGRCGVILRDDLEKLPQEKKQDWFTLFHHLHNATAGKPSQKFLKEAKPLVDAVGINEFKSHVVSWFNSLSKLQTFIEKRKHSWGGEEYETEVHEFIEQRSYNLLKGLMWSMSRFHDQTSLQAIAALTEKCFQKIPGIGPAAASVGNAGIYTLAESKGLGGISHLSRLKMKIRQNNTQKLIQKYIDEQAAKQGIKPAQVEEIAAPDYGLV
ncbi:MAG: hypothetical protein OQK04_10490, partial [Kangiellaceae bacterium]|nr:hypothetical protein [Kangiellaceae bacterium]